MDGNGRRPGTVVTRVWDWPVRCVHWAIVALLVTLVVTAKIGGDAMDWHVRAGETMLALVLFRLTWGFVGNRHARFSGFVRGPARCCATRARSCVRPTSCTSATTRWAVGW